MTIKEAILKSLEEIGGLTNYNDLTNHIISKEYVSFKDNRDPSASVSSYLGDFIRLGDSRVKRIKKARTYFYYLTKYEQTIEAEIISEDTLVYSNFPKQDKLKTFQERDLHKLLSSYLKSTDTYSKTIFHEQSNGKDSNQIWMHPDMVGIKFLNLQNKVSQNFLNSINRVDTFKICSYEIKKEIFNDTELKKAFFQAVSNSSWANYGYLVAFEFSDSFSLHEEMARLNESFGIGIIELKSNPYESRVLFTAKYRDLDFRTINKLCSINNEFEKFIEQCEKILTAEERYYKSTLKELDEFCDRCFTNDSEIYDYCKDKYIPLELEKEE